MVVRVRFINSIGGNCGVSIDSDTPDEFELKCWTFWPVLRTFTPYTIQFVVKLLKDHHDKKDDLLEFITTEMPERERENLETVIQDFSRGQEGKGLLTYYIKSMLPHYDSYRAWKGERERERESERRLFG